MKGFEKDLSQKIIEKLKIPLLVGGGCGSIDHIKDIAKKSNFSGVSLASILHYKKYDIREIKEELFKNNFKIVFHE